MSQLIKKFIGDDQVGANKILLENNSYLDGRNAANSSNVNLLKLDASDRLHLGDAATGKPVVMGAQLASDPTGVTAGFYYNTTDNAFKFYNGTSWAAMGGGGVSYPLLGSAGSAAAPTYSFSGDTDTGIYSSGANELSFSTNASRKLLLDTIALKPNSDNSFSIGYSGANFNSGYIRNLFVGNDAGDHIQINSGLSSTPSGSAIMGIKRAGTGTASAVGLTTTNLAGSVTAPIRLETGNVTSGAFASGDINLRVGTSTGTRGSIKFVDGSEGTIGHVWTSTGIDGAGAWAAPSGGGANTALSNLASVAINADLVFNLANAKVKTQDAAGASPSNDIYINSGDQSGTSYTGSVWIGSGYATGGSSTGSGGVSVFTGTSDDAISGILSLYTGSCLNSSTGALNISTGQGSTGAGNISMQTGNTTVSGPSGSVNINTGTSIVTNHGSGTISIYSGDALGTANSGTISIYTGEGEEFSGDLSLTTGGAAGGVNPATSGSLALSTGQANDPSGTSGSINISTGGGDLLSGDITITTGASSGTRGSVTIDANLITVTASILPNTNNSKDLGASGQEFLNIYVDNLYSSGNCGAKVWDILNNQINDNSGVSSIKNGARELYTVTPTLAMGWANDTGIVFNIPVQLVNLASDPSGPSAGTTYYNTTSNKLKFYNGTTWETVTSS